MLTADRLRELLDYNPATGEFRWCCKTGSKDARSIAGSPHKERYIRIMIDRKVYPAHRLAWLYIYGRWPLLSIDHINGDGFDNRVDNLRAVNHYVNLQNQRKPHKNNKTGMLGVHPQGDRFRSRLWVDGKNISLGMYDTSQEAYQAYINAKRQLHEGGTL